MPESVQKKEPEQCIFDKTELKDKIKEIIGGLKDANNDAKSAKTAAESANKILEEENKKLQQANVALKAENEGLETQKTLLTEQNETLRGDQGDMEKELSKKLDKFREEIASCITELSEKNTEINKLNTDLENQTKTSEKELDAQKTTSNKNMNKMISTLVSERNRLLEESEESKKEQEEALVAKDAELTDAKAKADAELTKLQAALKAKEEELTKCNQEKEQATQKAQAALKAKEEELTKCNQEKEELTQATESMKNIEKIQDFTKLSMTDIQTVLWNTAKKYMDEQFENPDYKKTITSDPFVQVELKTLLNDHSKDVTQDVTSAKIKEAHNKVIERHYNTIYPTSSDIKKVPQFPDHIVIPPYLYLSLTHFYTIFSFLNTRYFHMRFLNQDMKNQGQDLNLEPGFHIIIKKLGDGDQDFFSRVDVKFILLKTQTTAKDIIDKIFKESTFYGHIPTQTILQPGYIGDEMRGGNKTLKNNKRRLKKRRKYTQSNRRK
jgi:myosin heavy subunit